MRMSSNFSPQAMGIGHDGLHLFQGVLRGLRIVASGEHSAGGADLDQIGAVLNVLAHLVLNGGDSVSHSISYSVILVGQQIIVAVPAGDAERRTAHQHSGPGHIAGVDGVAQGDVAVSIRAYVAYGGKSGFERSASVLGAN